MHRPIFDNGFEYSLAFYSALSSQVEMLVKNLWQNIFLIVFYLDGSPSRSTELQNLELGSTISN